MTDLEWLEELFEFERCAECGGDAEHHTVLHGLNRFARCDFPPDEDGNSTIGFGT